MPRINQLFRIYQEKAGNDGAASGGAGSGGADPVSSGEESKTPTLEELQSQLEALRTENESMRTKNQQLLDETKTAKQRAKERQEAADKAAEEAARKNGDFDALEKSWGEKLSKTESEYKAKIEMYQANARKTHVDSVAHQIASEIANTPEDAKVILPHITSRLDMIEGDDGTFKTIIKDAEGKRSALSIADLSNEFLTNKSFSSVVRGTKANGGGGNGSKGAPALKAGSVEARKAATAQRLAAQGLK